MPIGRTAAHLTRMTLVLLALATMVVVEGSAIGTPSHPDRTDVSGSAAPPCRHGSSLTDTYSPLDRAHRNALFAVAAGSQDDVWAVGAEGPSTVRPLIEHWNGDAWHQFPSPTPGLNGRLNAVSVVSRNDVWAVGGLYHPSTNSFTTLIVHWNGTAWRRVLASDPGDETSNPILNGVTATSSRDVWAVGQYSQTTHGTSKTLPLVLHWDGIRWKQVPGPTPPSGADLIEVQAIAMVTPEDGWMSGRTSEQSPYLAHWDGQAWRYVRASAPGALFAGLASIAVIGPDDIWAVGLKYIGSENWRGFRGLAEHWDGHAWRPARLPPLYRTHGREWSLTGVVSDGQRVWAVGDIGRAGLVVRFGGRHWYEFPPSQRHSTGIYDGVAATGEGNLVAVGEGTWHVGWRCPPN